MSLCITTFLTYNLRVSKVLRELIEKRREKTHNVKCWTFMKSKRLEK